MSPDFDPNRLQGQYILSRGWLRSAPVSFAYHLLEQKPDSDLCDILVFNSMLTEAQAEEARRAVTELVRGAPLEDSLDATQRMGTVEEHLARRASERQGERHSELTNSLRSLRRDLVTGSRIERYEIIEEIARGGMGAVYRVRDTGDGRQVALKLLLTNEDLDLRVRFAREISALSKLRHPSVAKLYDSGRVGDLAYFTMELVEGPSLALLLQNLEPGEREQVLPWPRVVAYMREVALALAHCHDRGIIHRDVKPHNIVIDAKTDRPVLIDFGLLKRDHRLADEVSSSSRGLTKTGEALGTPAYMSPEQFGLGTKKPIIGPLSDVWSFGVTLYYALTGLLPFPSRDMLTLCLEVTKKPVPRLREVKPDAPEWLDDLVENCLRRKPYERPPMAELAQRLGASIGAPQTRRSKPEPRRGLRVALVLFALLSSVLAAALIFGPRQDARVLEASGPRRPVSVARAEIAGLADRGGALVRVRAERGAEILGSAQTDEQGRFRVEVALSVQGENRFLVSVADSDGAPVAVRVVFDSEAPTFSFDEQARGKAGVIIVGEDLLIRGRVSDPHFRDLTANERALEPDDQGRFAITVARTLGLEKIRLVATDSLDKTAELTLSYMTPLPSEEERRRQAANPIESYGGPAAWRSNSDAREAHQAKLVDLLTRYASQTLALASPPPAGAQVLRPAELASLELLRDIATWRDADRQRQALAARAADKALGADFQWLGKIEPFPQPDGSPAIPIAVFAHRRSGLEFSLVPGGRTLLPLFVLDLERLKSIYEDAEKEPPDIPQLVDSLRVDSGRVLRGLRFGDDFGLDEGSAGADLAERLLNEPSIANHTAGQLKKLLDRDRRRALRLPLFEVSLPPFLISRYEVSESEWAALTHSDSPTYSQGPKTGLSYREVTRALPDHLRLPLRAEWVYACRGGAADPRGLSAPERCVSRERSRATLPRSFAPRQPNGFGLVDMLGNVEEWCRPTWVELRDADPPAPELAGGDHREPAAFLGPGFYRLASAETRSDTIGLRLVVSLP